MKTVTLEIRSLLSALVALVVILSSTMLLAEQVARSAIYQQSQLVRRLFSQDSFSVSGLLTERRGLDLLVEFLGAVTTAYINFEMIPVNESNTFLAIFESINDAVTVDRFEYHGKNLTIVGTAESEGAYTLFLEALQDRNYFDSVTGHSYTTVDNTVRFELECMAVQTTPALPFPATD